MSNADFKRARVIIANAVAVLIGVVVGVVFWFLKNTVATVVAPLVTVAVCSGTIEWFRTKRIRRSALSIHITTGTQSPKERWEDRIEHSRRLLHRLKVKKDIEDIKRENKQS
jgi:hypothetical protein